VTYKLPYQFKYRDDAEKIFSDPERKKGILVKNYMPLKGKRAFEADQTYTD
jgi:hypothetical protein